MGKFSKLFWMQLFLGMMLLLILNYFLGLGIEDIAPREYEANIAEFTSQENLVPTTSRPLSKCDFKIFPPITISSKCTSEKFPIHPDSVFLNSQSTLPSDFWSIYRPFIFSSSDIMTKSTEPWNFTIRFVPKVSLLPYPWQSEAYNITVHGHERMVDIECVSILGLHRAFQTISQLIRFQKSQEDFQIEEAVIKDAPKWSIRAVLIDSPREFINVEEVFYTIQRSSLMKLNVLHWRFTDDQSFLYESQFVTHSHPKFYSKEDILRVREFAASRGVIILPELDVPGHARGWSEQMVMDLEYIHWDTELHRALQSRSQNIPKMFRTLWDIQNSGRAKTAKSPFDNIFHELRLQREEMHQNSKLSRRLLGKKTWIGATHVSYEAEIVSLIHQCNLPDGKRTGFMKFYLPSVWELIENTIGEFIEMFPDAKYIHLGGDELFEDCFTFEFLARLSLFAITKNLHVYDVHSARHFFEIQLWKILEKWPDHYFLRWDDAYRAIEWNATTIEEVPKNVIYESWFDQKVMEKANSRKQFSMNAWQYRYYMDVVTREIEQAVAPPIQMYERIRRFSPNFIQKMSGGAKVFFELEETHYVLGGSVCMWETGFSEFHFRLWPLLMGGAAGMWANEQIAESFDIDEWWTAMHYCNRIDSMILPLTQNFTTTLNWRNITFDGWKHLEGKYSSRGRKSNLMMF